MKRILGLLSIIIVMYLYLSLLIKILPVLKDIEVEMFLLTVLFISSVPFFITYIFYRSMQSTVRRKNEIKTNQEYDPDTKATTVRRIYSATAAKTQMSLGKRRRYRKIMMTMAKSSGALTRKFFQGIFSSSIINGCFGVRGGRMIWNLCKKGRIYGLLFLGDS
jgi:hypothetical protein